MELAESIESINASLRDDYGYHTIERPHFRVVWSEDQFEKRYGTYTDSHHGIFIREVTEVREVPKYRQYVQEKFILERLTVVPTINHLELLEENYSYEPVWVFENKEGKYLPPRIVVCQFIIENLLGRIGNSRFARYTDKNESDEEYQARIKGIEAQLFGNETDVGDALAQDSAVGYGTRQRNDDRIR